MKQADGFVRIGWREEVAEVVARSSLFLFVRNRRDGYLDVTELDCEAARAGQISGEAERYYWDEPWMDVILLGADSLETLRSTHANWFPDWEPDLSIP